MRGTGRHSRHARLQAIATGLAALAVAALLSACGGEDSSALEEPEGAFEVTPDGETVWEWVSPERAGERGELVAALFDMERLPADHPFQGSAEGP